MKEHGVTTGVTAVANVACSSTPLLFNITKVTNMLLECYSNAT